MKKLIVIIMLCAIALVACTQTSPELAAIQEPAEEPPAAEPAPEQIAEPETALPEVAEPVAPPASAGDITITRDAATPEEITIQAGGQVTFAIDDVAGKRHSITCTAIGANPIISGNIEGAGSWIAKFPEAGTFKCLDVVYGVKATVNVE
ncbi:hypothetical protein J4464_07615 [Candidatus Woesearchaeota archaeon]|nr:hypothetical protein [Candidatus Woesearchaeota archaeon]